MSPLWLAAHARAASCGDVGVTQIINALRGHLAEYGLIAPQGPSHADRLIAQIEDPTSSIPEAARCCFARLVDVLCHLQVEIDAKASHNKTNRRELHRGPAG